MSEFSSIKQAITAQFERMKKHPLFRVGPLLSPGTENKEEVIAEHKDKMYAMYLGSFPSGSNPIYKERTEHDCTCCRQFIRNAGEESMIKPKRVDSNLQLAHDILKEVITVRMAEADAESKKKERATERAKLLDLLAKKEDETLEGLSKEEIRAKLNALDE